MKNQSLTNTSTSSCSKKSNYRIVLLFLFLGMSINSSYASFIAWTGGTGDWNISSNWSNGIPTTADFVYIGSGSIVTIPSGYSAEVMRMESDGVLIIDGSLLVEADVFNTNIGIRNNHRIINNGNLEILNVILGSAIHNDGSDAPTKSFQNNGSILIHNCGYGINNKTTFNNKINGTIQFQSLEANGILNDSIFSNRGSLVFDAPIFWNAIDNRGLFKNVLATSTIDINDSGIHGIKNHMSAELNNWGTITIDKTDDHAIRNTSSGTSLTNYGSISIGGEAVGLVLFHGISNENNAEITNMGIINVGSTLGVGLFQTATAGQIQNHGTLNLGGENGLIHDCGMDVRASFHNYGDINMNSILQDGLVCNADSFFNSGTIRIGENDLQPMDNGIINNSVIINDGEIIIEKVLTTGIINQSTTSNISVFTNGLTGLIHLGENFPGSYSCFNGIINKGNVVFKNHGNINIENSLQNAYWKTWR